MLKRWASTNIDAGYTRATSSRSFSELYCIHPVRRLPPSASDGLENGDCWASNIESSTNIGVGGTGTTPSQPEISYTASINATLLAEQACDSEFHWKELKESHCTSKPLTVRSVINWENKTDRPAVYSGAVSSVTLFFTTASTLDDVSHHYLVMATSGQRPNENRLMSRIWEPVKLCVIDAPLGKLSGT